MLEINDVVLYCVLCIVLYCTTDVFTITIMAAGISSRGLLSKYLIKFTIHRKVQFEYDHTGIRDSKLAAEFCNGSQIVVVMDVRILILGMGL